MGFGGPIFIILIILIATVGWVVTTAIRARHGYPLTDDWGNQVAPPPRSDPALEAENRALQDKVEKLEKRMKVLERIATDPSKRLSDEIDELREAE